MFFDTVPFHGTDDFQIIRLLKEGKRPRRLESPIMAGISSSAVGNPFLLNV